MAWLVVILLALLLSAILAAVRFFLRNADLARRLDAANDRRREITNFLNRFSSGLQVEGGVEGAMHGAARHVAEQTDADAVAIYDFSGDELRATGVCGAYPLVHSSNPLIYTRHHHLFETLRREKIRVGRGFLGGVAASRQPELVPDASADPRFTEFPEEFYA